MGVCPNTLRTTPTPMIPVTFALAAGTLIASGALVLAEWRGARAARVAAKVLASTGFVALALSAGTLADRYGRLLLVALVLSWLGDLLLLGHARAAFLGGLGAFLLAHVAFAAAFATRPLAPGGLLAGGALMLLVGASTLRWLWPHLEGAYRGAVSAYVLAIGAMVTLAIAAATAPGWRALAVAALAFAASDISVARDRFVAPGLVNRVWGL